MSDYLPRYDAVAETPDDRYGRTRRISYKLLQLPDLNVEGHQHKLLKRPYGFVERVFRSLELDGWDVNITVAAPMRMWFPARKGTRATYEIQVKVNAFHELFRNQPDLMLLAWVEVIDAVPDSQLPRGDGIFMPTPTEVHSSAMLTESSRQQLGSKFFAASKCKSLMLRKEQGEDGIVTFKFIWKDFEPQLHKGPKQLMFVVREKCPPGCRPPLQMHILYKPPLIRFARTEQFPAAAQTLAWRTPDTAEFLKADLDKRVTLTAKLNLEDDDTQDVERDDWRDIMDADRAEDQMQHNDGLLARSQPIDQTHMQRLAAGRQDVMHVGAATVVQEGTLAANNTSAHVQGTGEGHSGLYMQPPRFQRSSLDTSPAAGPWDTRGDAHTPQRDSPHSYISSGLENVPGGDTYRSPGWGASSHGAFSRVSDGRQPGGQAARDGMTAGDPGFLQRFQRACQVGYGGAGSQVGYQASCNASASGQGAIEHHEHSRMQPDCHQYSSYNPDLAGGPRVPPGHTRMREHCGDQGYVPQGPAIPGGGQHRSPGWGASSHGAFSRVSDGRQPGGQAARGRGEPGLSNPVTRHLSHVHNPRDGHDVHTVAPVLHGHGHVSSGHSGPGTNWSRGRGKTKTTGRGRGRAAQDPNGGGASSSPEEHSGIGEGLHQMQSDPAQAPGDSAEIEPGWSLVHKDVRRATGGLLTAQQRSRGHAAGGGTTSTLSSYATSRDQSVTTRTSSTPSHISQDQAAWRSRGGDRQ